MFFFPRRVIQDSHPQEPPCGAAQPGDKCYEDSCLAGGFGGRFNQPSNRGMDLGPSKVTLYINPWQSLFGNGWLVGWLEQFKRANLCFWRDNFSRDFCFPFLIEAHDLE